MAREAEAGEADEEEVAREAGEEEVAGTGRLRNRNAPSSDTGGDMFRIGRRNDTIAAREARGKT